MTDTKEKIMNKLVEEAISDFDKNVTLMGLNYMIRNWVRHSYLQGRIDSLKESIKRRITI